MPESSPLRPSTFSKQKSNGTGSNSSLRPGSPISSRNQPSPLGFPANSSTSLQKDEGIPRKPGATFFVEDDPIDSINSQSKLNDNLKPTIALDSPSSVPLQDMFYPPVSPINPRSPRPSTTAERPRSLFGGSQASHDKNEDVNQMTIQTLATDFIVPQRTDIRFQRSKRRSPPKKNWKVTLVRFFKRGRVEINVSAFKHIVKSAIAFFIASLFVIVRPLQEIVGPFSYMAPFFTVVFDSTRTIGAQVEIAFITCVFLGFSLLYYMLALWFFVIYNARNLRLDSDDKVVSNGAFIIGLFFYTAIFVVGWVKARYAKLSLPAALMGFFLIASMTGIDMKAQSFSIERFGYTLVGALVGIFISLFVNLVLWPESASQDLGKSLEMALENSHRSIQTITQCFLLSEDTLNIRAQDLEDLHSRSMTVANTLIRAGKEARYEYTYSVHPPSDYKSLISIILSLQQQLGGFNLAAQRERLLLSLSKLGDEQKISPLSSRRGSTTELKGLSLPPSPSAISLNKLAEDLMPVGPEIDPALARSLIHDIIHFVKDPLISLNDVCLTAIQAACQALTQENELEEEAEEEEEHPEEPRCCCHCGPSNGSACSHEDSNPEDPLSTTNILAITKQLQKAITEFELAEGRCLHLIHQQLLFTPHLHAPFPEPMLVVFSGIFSVREFAKELINLLEEVTRFQNLRPMANQGLNILGGPRKSKPKRFWRPRVGLSKWLQGYRAAEEPRKAECYEFEATDISTVTSKAASELYASKEEIDSLKDEEDEQDDPIQLPNQRWTKPNYFVPVSEPPPPGWTIWLRSMLCRIFQNFSSYEVRYGLKLTFTIILLTFPAFVPAFYEQYSEFKGSWGAVAALFIINQTIGGTLYLGLVRLIGTIIGAFWGYLTYIASNKTQNMPILILMIWIFNAPAWYAIITTNYSKIGFNGLVTFTVILFINYGHDDGSLSILDVALIRTVCVLVGLVVAMVISSLLWPYVARNEVRKSISGLMADIGVNFGKVAALCMSPASSSDRVDLDRKIREQQQQLQKRLLSTKTLLLFASKEPRLKGPFPGHVYEEQLRVLQDILDQLAAMRSAVLQIGPEVQATVIFPFNSYRKFMVSSVILYFYVLAGALRAKHPLPPYPPPIHAIRYKLMLKTRAAMVRKYQRTYGRGNSTSLRRDASMNAIAPFLSSANNIQHDPSSIRGDFSHIYWYTYMAGLVRLFEDVELLGHNVSGLVGEATFPVPECFGAKST